jgi:hypothetical protein
VFSKNQRQIRFPFSSQTSISPALRNHNRKSKNICSPQQLYFLPANLLFVGNISHVKSTDPRVQYSPLHPSSTQTDRADMYRFSISSFRFALEKSKHDHDSFVVVECEVLSSKRPLNWRVDGRQKDKSCLNS